MGQLIREIARTLMTVVAGWFLPLFTVSVGASVFSIIVVFEPRVAGVVLLFIIGTLELYLLVNRMGWQAGMWLALLLPLATLSYVENVAGALYWALGLQLLSLAILYILGEVVWPSFRLVVRRIAIAAILLTAVLAGCVFTGGWAALALLGLLVIGAAALLLSRAARPWEIRRAQRRAGRLLAALGLVLIIAGILYNLLPAITKLIP